MRIQLPSLFFTHFENNEDNNMSHSKLRFVISLLAFTAMAFLLASCWSGGGPKTNTNAPTEGPSPSGGNLAGLSLNYQNKFNSNQETLGRISLLSLEGAAS